MSSESSTPNCTPQPRMVVHNLYIPDPSADEIDLSTNQPWMVATVINDDDLMFGGKPLCAWYEEDRRRFGCATVEEETRGRPRERARADAHYERSQKQPQHHHHQPRQQHPQHPLQAQPQHQHQHQQQRQHHLHRSGDRSPDVKEE
ncbi:uncharacterized protein P884DRAFT_277591 [Thermothelomyces heterothallicus CBS 202.75]|uniref:uncharacterized protein n=1 Tax=Thermothelomyces heterothallicus CBS 202.75 TaxID=1149848 RepID=UPI0037422211